MLKQYLKNYLEYYLEVKKRKLLDSINERAKLNRLTLQPIDQQIKDSFESLADKIESQED